MLCRRRPPSNRVGPFFVSFELRKNRPIGGGFFVVVSVFNMRNSRLVIPTKVGIQAKKREIWIPASAGMTEKIKKITDNYGNNQLERF